VNGKKIQKETSVHGIALCLLLLFSSYAIVGSYYQPQPAKADSCGTLQVSGLKADEYQGSNMPKNTVDNSLDTRWSSPGKGAWIQFDTGQEVKTCSVDIAWYKGNSRQYSFTVAVSGDGNSYSTVFSGKSSGNTISEERYDFADVAARYIKITVLGNTQNNWASITEVDLDGYVASPPTIAFSNVDGSLILAGTYTVQVSASDPARISKIDMYVDSAFIKTEYNDPYLFSLDTSKFADGSHTLKAIAKDTSGNFITATKTASFKNAQDPPSTITPTNYNNTTTTTTPSTGGKKYLLATMLQYVNTDTLVNIYSPNMENTDKPRIHVGLNKQVTDTQLKGLLSLPGQHGLEYFSLAEIKLNAPLLRDRGIEVIDYDLEPGDGHSPTSDLVDPVASIKAASQAAHANGLLFRCSPSKSITTNYGAQLAPYCDQYHIQAQGLQDRPVDYELFVEDTAAKLRRANPSIEISVQVSTQRPAASWMTLLQTMETDWARVADKVDGVSVWYSNDDEALSVLKSFAQWFDTNYREQ
jgi:hypothetical protein